MLKETTKQEIRDVMDVEGMIHQLNDIIRFARYSRATLEDVLESGETRELYKSPNKEFLSMDEFFKSYTVENLKMIRVSLKAHDKLLNKAIEKGVIK